MIDAGMPISREPPIPNARLATLLLIGTEIVLFSSFIGAYIVLRMGSTTWPPLGVPSLYADLSILNTSLLIVSSILMAKRWIRTTLGLGIVFLLLQALEFHRLYARGLTLQSGPYGALFYSLVSCHGLHVLGGLAFLGVALRRRDLTGNAALFWHFVTGIWLVLFAILYLI